MLGRGRRLASKEQDLKLLRNLYDSMGLPPWALARQLKGK